METLTVQNRPLASLSSGQAAHLYITIGFATTPPSRTEPEAGLRGQPLAEATRKNPQRKKIEYVQNEVYFHSLYDITTDV